MRRQITTIVVTAGLTLGPAAIASAQPVSPDARDANTAAQQANVTSSVASITSPDAYDANVAAREALASRSVSVTRSPDAADANVAAREALASRSVADPRSPDARDAEDVLVIPHEVLSSTQIRGVQPVASPNNGGFGWDDAGMVLGGIAILALLGLATTLGVQHRRHTGTPLAH